MDAFRERPELKLWIDVQRYCPHDIELWLTDGRHSRAVLAIEVRELEMIEIRDAETTDAEPRNVAKLYSADSSQTADRDPLRAQRLLFFPSDPSDIADKGFFIVE